MNDKSAPSQEPDYQVWDSYAGVWASCGRLEYEATEPNKRRLYTHPAPSQEPVAWMRKELGPQEEWFVGTDEDHDGCAPLYTTPPDAAQIAELERQLASLAKGVKIQVPSVTMEQEFSNFHRLGYNKAKKECEEQIAKLEAERDAYRSALKMYANDKHLDCTIALRVLEEQMK